jgi:hypothetical protein
MTNKMKTAKIKTIVVECKLKDFNSAQEFEIDSEIFDDTNLEAATRFVEHYISNNNLKISPTLNTYEKRDVKNPNKHVNYNSYYIIVNAGYYKKAENMRSNFLKISNIDLKKESLKSSNNGN